MAKLNEGDVIEGIFAIAVALYIAHGKVDKGKLNSIRTKIDTKIFNEGRFKYTILKEQTMRRAPKPADVFSVILEMRLKPKSVQGAFDKEFEILYKSSRDIGKIDAKIDQLIKSFNGQVGFSRKISTAINLFLENNVSDNVTFTVVADGIAGESSGGQIKGDVVIEIFGVSGSKKQKIFSMIPFSLKSDSSTVANLAPYRGMLDLAKALKIKWDAEKKYERLSRAFNGSEEQKIKFQLIGKMYQELQKKIIEQSKSATFTKDAMNLLGESIFGSDLADVVDVRSGSIKELSVQQFNILKTNIKLGAQVSGNNVVFFDVKTKIPIFKIRTKLREGANEAKFYLELGNGIYDKK